ncbi:TetR/AcrR family transcriptional regulator [Halobaculum lipolyticum]|uniref:TetR/AcrR family transcriptional regulator n=1 Tax=Halobaculum lipolyticum TaxID=3032001 RepID=A0ABD5W9D0_9EURY|nr:TetR/AcrR family transcriptional regulator [Halobaculum sp. DT31]
MSSDGATGDTKARIMDAVRVALAKHGYADLTTKKVAAEADVSEAGIFYHYDSKDELVAAFVEWCAEGTSTRFDDLPDDPTDRLYAACDVLLVAEDDPQAAGVSVAFMELLSHAPYDETLQGPLRRYEEFVLGELADVVRAGVESGAFRDVDPEATAAFLLAACDGVTGFGLALDMTEANAHVRERLRAYLDTVVVADP